MINDRDERLNLYARQILTRWDAAVEQLENMQVELEDKRRRRIGHQINLMAALRRSLKPEA